MGHPAAYLGHPPNPFDGGDRNQKEPARDDELRANIYQPGANSMTLDLRGLILIFVLATTPSAKGQAGSPESSQLNMRVARFELANETLFDGLSKLGSEGISLGIALEEVLKEKESDSPLAEPRSSIILQHRTVREILD